MKVQRFTGLWQHTNFRRFWGAFTVSHFGSGITFLAVPIIGAVLLEASPTQMGLLTAAATFPYLLFGLPAGVWVDRLRKRPLLVVADLGRMCLLGTIPLAALLDRVSFTQLVTVAFLGGILTLLADVAEEAYLPVLISRDNLVEGYSKLAATDSILELSGPAVAATLVELLTAPLAVVIDALSYLISALFLGSIRSPEPLPTPEQERPSFWVDMKVGLSFIRHHNYLRPMLLNNATMQFFGGMVGALLVLYLTRTLNLPATFVGVIFATGSATGLLAAAWGKRAAQRFGLNWMVLWGAVFIGLGSLIRPLAVGTPLLAAAILLAGQAVQGFGNTLYNIGYDSLAQSLTPDHLLGRVNAAGLFLSWGALSIGSLTGGFLGTWLGLRLALAVSGIGVFGGFFWVFFSPLRLASTQEAINA